MTERGERGVLAELRRVAETEGFVEGSEPFKKRMDQLQVQKCRELRGYFLCTECNVYDYCELVKKVMRVYRGYE